MARKLRQPESARHDGRHDHEAHEPEAEHVEDGHRIPDHQHRRGLIGMIAAIFAPHSHDSADSVDSALETSVKGIRAVKLSLLGLLATSGFQVGIVLVTGSVALLADTIHNFSDALTAIPLWVAFVLGRRTATKRYTYGYRRAEDLAGVFIVAMILFSAVLAGWESIARLFHPQVPSNPRAPGPRRRHRLCWQRARRALSDPGWN